MLFVYCLKKLEMQTDSAAVLSVCPSQGNSSDLLATVRCQAGTRRLWMRIRHSTDSTPMRRAETVRVLIYALPAGAPRVARLITLKLPSLPYYSQHEDPDVDKDSRSWCRVQASGGFSVAEMTSWLSEALPGELPRPSNKIAFGRRHILLQTVLTCRYQRGLAVFKSNNISTAVIIRDVISYCSVENNIRVETSCDVPDDCCLEAFRMLKSHFKEEYQKHKDIHLKNCLNAMDLDSNTMKDESPILCEEYLRVWDAPADDIGESHFSELVDTMEQWYVDWRTHSMRGREKPNERTQLHDALRDCNVNVIERIFSKESQNQSPQELF